MKKKKFIIVLGIMCIAVLLGACGNVNKSALHINYGEDENYGSGDYVFSTVTITGDELHSEKVFSVKELEELTSDESLAYEGTYSMLTRGSIFSQHKMTGLKLYELLLYAGLDVKADKDTKVRIISADGYASILSLDEIKESMDNTYSSMEDKEPAGENVPVIVAFGSDGLPLTGPVGSKVPGDEITEEEGYSQNEENVGGPVRLIAGQKSSDEFNAPDNAKWVRKIIVGDEVDLSYDDKTALTITAKDEEGNTVDQGSFTCGELAAFNGTEENYYGKKNWYKGANLWQFVASNLDFASREGTVKFLYNDGSSQVIDMEYFRNVKGDFSKYTVAKEGLTITNIKPALGYAVNGEASQRGVYALLPAVKGYVKTSTAKPVSAIEINLKGDAALSENPYGSSLITIDGDGVKKSGDITVSELESYNDLMVTSGSQRGISLAGFLEARGLAIDAEKITIEGDTTVKYTMDQLHKNKDKLLLVTRQDGNAIDEGGPVKCEDVNSVTDIHVEAKEGQWTHREKPYKRYLKSTLKLSGSEVNSAKYTLKELENSEYTVKDTFGSSAGIDGYQGVALKKIIQDNLKSEIDKPTKITVIGEDGYETELAVDDVWNGIDSQYQQGEHRDVIIAYSLDGEPLVKNKKAAGFTGENGFGPMRLVVENQISKWVKNVVQIKIGE
ncbi:MAG: hypothetical protein GX663_07400 [Clostridiales bacterium]|nr:hypothetical protein [Clostridiales bacterium]